MSDTNRAQLAYVAESSFGVQVTGTPLQILRYTTESLARQVGAASSNAIRGDRQVPGVRHMRVDTAGPINFELAYGEFDTLLAAALLSAGWAAPVTVESSGTVSAVASGNKYTTSGSWDTTPTAGQWVKVSGFALAGNSGLSKVVSATTTEIVVAGKILVDEADKAGVSITQGGAITNGTTLSYFNVEKAFLDLSNKLALFLGQTPNGLSLNVPTEGFVTGTFDMIGSNETSLSASGGTGYTAAATTEPFASLDLTSLMENELDTTITTFTMRLGNNLRTRMVAGSSGVLSIGTGRIDLSGTLQRFFENTTIYDKFLDETPSSIALALADAAGNAYVLDIPRLKYTSGQRPISGPNGEVIADMGWTAYMHPTEGVTLRLVRFPAA